MYILELVTKNFEGTWIQTICVSRDANKLKERIIVERKKYLAIEDYALEMFLVGDLENFMDEKKKQAQESYNSKDNSYVIDGVKIRIDDIKSHLILIGTPLATSLGLSMDILKKVVSSQFYESLSYRVREVEDI